MPSTYSPSLRLELMGAGDQAGNWGNTTNTNLGSLIEQAITGVGYITMSDATTTLTPGSGILDQARNAAIILLGTLTANRELIIPSVNKLYIIGNYTTGGYNVTVKTSSGTGFVVKNNFSLWVYCDGTNVYSASIPSRSVTGANLQNATITGDLTVEGTVFSGGGPVMPTGSILEYGGTTAPTGWLLCDGASVSRATYAALFAVIGTAYGSVDGSTFNVPDRRDRVAVGAGSTYTRGQAGGATTSTTSLNGSHAHGEATVGHALTEAQMPIHQHGGATDGQGSHDHGFISDVITASAGPNPGFSAGSLYNPTGTINVTQPAGVHFHNITTDFRGSNQAHAHAITYDGSHQHTTSTIQPYVASNFIIKA